MSYPIKSCCVWSDLAVWRGTALHRSIERNHYCKSNTRPSKDQKVIERTLSVFGKERNRSRKIQPSLSSCPVWVLSPQTPTFRTERQNRKGNHKRIRRQTFERTYTRDFGIWASILFPFSSHWLAFSLTISHSSPFTSQSIAFHCPFIVLRGSFLVDHSHSIRLYVRPLTIRTKQQHFPLLYVYMYEIPEERSGTQTLHCWGHISNTLDMTNAWVTLVISSFFCNMAWHSSSILYSRSKPRLHNCLEWTNGRHVWGRVRSSWCDLQVVLQQFFRNNGDQKLCIRRNPLGTQVHTSVQILLWDPILHRWKFRCCSVQALHL